MRCLLTLGALLILWPAESARALPEMLAAAMELGAQDCLFCHTEASGGKNWNGRGQWLLDEKRRRGAEEIVVGWLREYEPEEETISAGPIEGPANIPKTLRRGPFFEPRPEPEKLKGWIATRGAYTTARDEWPQYAGDIGSAKYSPLDQIEPENVSRLELAWVWDAFDNERFITPDGPKRDRSKTPDGFKATPIMVGGKLFVRTNFSAVAAIDPATGRTLWTYDPGTGDGERPGIYGFATRGLSYWTDGDDQRLLLATGDGYLIALNPQTGKPIESFGKNGSVDLTAGLRRPLIRKLVNFSAPVTIVRDTAVIGHQIADGAPGTSERNGGADWKSNWPVGDVRGYDVRTGELRWTFQTIPQSGQYGNETWGDESWRWIGNTNIWSMMSGDEQLGYVYLPVTAPTYNWWGGFREGDNLFANSVVCLDAETGKRVWHFQTVHHDIWDWDLPAAPTLMDITVEGKKIAAVAQVAKTGFVYVFDRRTGEPVWPIEERPVPGSDIEQEHPSATQPFPTKPPPFEMQGISEDSLIDFTAELRARALEAVAPLKMGPMFTPPSPEGTIFLPGWGGGANWGGAGYDPETGYLYLASRRSYITIAMKPVADPDRRGYAYEDEFKRPNISGLPVVKPPYGSLTAYDMNRGEIAWQVPLGEGPRDHPLLKDLDLPPLGNPNVPGVLVTKTLLFAGDGGSASAGRGSREASTLRAYDKATGDLLWQRELPGRHHHAAPMTYRHNGRQYVVVGVGAVWEPARLAAFALPE